VIAQLGWVESRQERMEKDGIFLSQRLQTGCVMSVSVTHESLKFWLHRSTKIHSKVG